jgi:hypothetical protein
MTVLFLSTFGRQLTESAADEWSTQVWASLAVGTCLPYRPTCHGVTLGMVAFWRDGVSEQTAEGNIPMQEEEETKK